MSKPVEYYRQAAKERHPLHLKIGDLFEEIYSDNLVRDQACGGNQNIPLFRYEHKSRSNEFCNVDLLVLKNGKISVLVEIEESNIKPTQVCGKYLTAALSRYYIHKSSNNDTTPMADHVTFIQFVDTSKLKRDQTSKMEQWKNLQAAIREIIPVENSTIKEYVIFDVSVDDFLNDEQKINKIKEYLSNL